MWNKTDNKKLKVYQLIWLNLMKNYCRHNFTCRGSLLVELSCRCSVAAHRGSKPSLGWEDQQILCQRDGFWQISLCNDDNVTADNHHLITQKAKELAFCGVQPVRPHGQGILIHRLHRLINHVFFEKQYKNEMNEIETWLIFKAAALVPLDHIILP